MIGLSSSLESSPGHCAPVFPLDSECQAATLAYRPADYKTEARLQHACLTALAKAPHDALDTMPALMLEQFHAGSAGISMASVDGEARRFTWTAIAGEWRRYAGLPEPASLTGLTPPAEDCLSLPFTHEGHIVGAVWVASHDPHHLFDAEDLRLLQACTACASAAYRHADRVAHRESRRKDILIATLAHELREPAGAILNAAGVLRQTIDRTGQQRAVDALERQAVHMRRLIDDVLDMARLAEGKLELHKERLDARQTVWDACATTSGLFRGRQQTLSTTLPAGPVWLHADHTRVQQVLTNLLGNAAKFTPHSGEIAVVLTVDPEKVDIRIRDNGRGIRADMLPHVFEPFVQETISSAGLGLGLKVVRELVELHGGSVTAHSEGAGKGSEFIVRFPLVAPG